MPSQVTVTAKTGPAVQATALIITEVTNMNFDLVKRVLQVFQGSTVKEFDLSTVTTTTFTISGVNYTMVVS